ncbi:MAG: FeoB-associated Cys-rich membrane protein [Lachnospiraceae bacterium]|nr:FeoB-associated Cys-rich membrane protein [Lachnospiraceae bacterium]MBP5265053.1 FeoB-associated Cys-rich membrane protein [Lachnospiraceae bacterium]MBP5733015.1 FeoB-associated Cys-rich membrane protein [Lachnospiraceae bacterium]MBR3468457.1 FeoB-associated Cys-rich membrane protein [Lachnospiraceae bacterium]MCR5500702.1 FeoB-associated Cys-rich membrane protein [Acetatifactor sp.]
MSFLVANAGTIVISIILVAVLSFILYNMIKNKRRGKSSCGCNCNCCPAGGACHRYEQQKQSVGGRLS